MGNGITALDFPNVALASRNLRGFGAVATWKALGQLVFSINYIFTLSRSAADGWERGHATSEAVRVGLVARNCCNSGDSDSEEREGGGELHSEGFFGTTKGQRDFIQGENRPNDPSNLREAARLLHEDVNSTIPSASSFDAGIH
jgi:hypothetical protein